MPPASAAMIVRNEEARLEEALRSLQRLSALDEIVILDTGSTDRTLEIARDLGARVYEQPWQDDFSFHRNRCLELCRNDWVLSFDGDEVLEDPGDLDAFFDHPTADGALVWIQTRCQSQLQESFLSLRVFDRRKGSWRFPVHNQLVGLGTAVATTARVTAWYEPSDVAVQRRRVQILIDALEREPDCAHHLYFVAKTLRMLRDWEGALAHIDRYLALPGGEDRAAVWAWKVEALLELGLREEATAVLAEALRAHPDFPELCFYDFLFAAKRWYEAAASPPIPYLLSPSTTLPFAARFPEAARVMGLPIEFSDNPTFP